MEDLLLIVHVRCYCSTIVRETERERERAATITFSMCAAHCKVTPLITESFSEAQNMPAGVGLVTSHCSRLSLTSEDKQQRIEWRCVHQQRIEWHGLVCFIIVGIMQSSATTNKQCEFLFLFCVCLCGTSPSHFKHNAVVAWLVEKQALLQNNFSIIIIKIKANFLGFDFLEVFPAN